MKLSNSNIDILVDGIKIGSVSKLEISPMTPKKFINEITEIFNRHDPQGLLKMGAPSDEYSTEIKRLISQLKHCQSLSDVQTVIYSIMVCQFTIRGAGEPVQYHNLATDIWDYYNHHQDFLKSHLTDIQILIKAEKYDRLKEEIEVFMSWQPTRFATTHEEFWNQILTGQKLILEKLK